MTILNRTFYPSPEPLVRALLSPYDFTNAYVLDPSAGDGRVLEAVREKSKPNFGHYERKPQCKVFACEIEPDLRAVLKEKEIPIVSEDFLEYHDPSVRYTHIIMNPPFNGGEGVRHLLHAWEILRAGHLACVLPKSSLEGETIYRHTLRNLLNDYGGTVEDVGQIYRGSERPTDEDLCIVRLVKPDPDGELSFDYENDSARHQKEFSDGPGDELSLGGHIPPLLAAFAALKNEFDVYVASRMKMERYARMFNIGHTENASKIITAAETGMKPSVRYNNMIDAIQEVGWNSVLEHPSFQFIMTDRARNMFTKFKQQQASVDFTEQNIYNFLQELHLRSKEILNSVITDAFDQMTKWHSTNRCGEGWVSNTSWKVNKKIVVPWGVDPTYNMFILKKRNEYDDIDRALCVVGERRFDEITTVTAVASQQRYGSDVRCESTFFDIRLFKKGTVHLKFKDEELLERFNLRAAQAKGWLPDDTTPTWAKANKRK